MVSLQKPEHIHSLSFSFHDHNESILTTKIRYACNKQKRTLPFFALKFYNQIHSVSQNTYTLSPSPFMTRTKVSSSQKVPWDMAKIGFQHPVGLFILSLHTLYTSILLSSAAALSATYCYYGAFTNYVYKICLFLTTYPLRLHFLWYKSLQKVDFFDHLPTSSCKRSL